MNRILRRIMRSLFAPITGASGAIASSIGFFLSFLPLHSLRIPFLLVLSLLLRLNLAALILGTLIPIFTPNLRHLPFLNLSGLGRIFQTKTMFNDGSFTLLGTQINLSQTIPAGVLGGMIGLVCYVFFHLFYNLRIKKREQNQDHIFLDPAKRRWSLIKRVSAGFAAVIILVSALFIESLNTNPKISELKLKKNTQTNEIIPINQRFSERQLASQLQSTVPSTNFNNIVRENNNKRLTNQEVYAFYVNWDKNSKASFKRNIHSITTLLPEWLQLQPDLSFKTSTDSSITAEANAHHIKIIPVVYNFYNNQWEEKTLHQLLTKPGAQDLFIENLLAYVKSNNFAGINIDFENINQKDKAHFTHFMDKVSKVFHKHRLLVTLDIPPNNPSYDYHSLSKDVDRVVVMLYDQHYSTSNPGPIAQNNWVNESLSALPIPSQKLIVGLGSYGYDWKENAKQPPKIMTYGDILKLGLGTNLKIYWNRQSGNPYFRYKLNGHNHTVWFLDGATFYNQMKLGEAHGSIGIAIWRLGSEDPSIWNYVNKPKALSNPAPALKTLVSPKSIYYTGAGEILRVVSQPQKGKRIIQMDSHGRIQNEFYKKFPTPFEVARYGKPQTKKIALTFDDGPNKTYTPEILDILDKNHIKGTFFVVGRNAELYPKLVKRMYNDGQEIGSHTFTHPNIAAITPWETKMQLNANQRLFEEITGHSMNLFRPPYQIDTEPTTRKELLPILRAQNLGYTTVGAGIDSLDWKHLSSHQIVKRVIDQLSNGNVILFHDAGGNRSNTVKALPIIIKELKQRGYTFTTVAHLIGKSHEQIMPSAKDNPYLIYDKAIFKVMQVLHDGLSIIFYSAILLGILRLIIFVFLSRRQIKTDIQTPIDPDFKPFVSVVIAAYNEDKVICKTVDSILSSDYPNFEVLVIDDGSKDDTAIVIEETYGNHPRVQLIRKTNGGKSSAVNVGFKEAKGEIVVALDADTLIAENAISLLAKHFKNENVAAVSGNVKVGNNESLLTNWQHIEYVTGFNLERRAFAALNCITVVPGAIGAWRKTDVEEAGYFKEDTLAEDTDITLTLLRHGKKIEFEEKAYAYTEVPEDIKSLAKQRYRWVYGTLQCLWKHREALFNKNHNTLGFIGLPNMWLFQYFYQTISPIADILFIVALFSNHPGIAAAGFILFYLLDFFTSFYAFKLEKESPRPLTSLFLQRILYKQLMTYVVLKSIFSAIKGVTVSWNKLKRKGNVTQNTHIEKVKENM